MNTNLRILFAGGGSGGHLTPGIALAEELRRRDPGCEILFAASNRTVDQRIMARSDFEVISLPVAPAPRGLSDLGTFATQSVASARAAVALLQLRKPNIVIGLGGFASVPVGLAARWNRLPLVLLEQNIVPGRANSLLRYFADVTCLSFADAKSAQRRSGKTILTGNPIRNSIIATPHDRKRSELKTLLVLGGSQGSLGMNEIVRSAVAGMRLQHSDWRIVHQTGERDVVATRRFYQSSGITAEVSAYFDDLPARYHVADLAISRAGATTLAELAYVGLPTILIPFPQSVRDHQQKNAEHFVAAGAAVIVNEAADAVTTLQSYLVPLAENETLRRSMSLAMRTLAQPNAADVIADVVLRYCRESHAGSLPQARAAA